MRATLQTVTFALLAIAVMGLMYTLGAWKGELFFTPQKEPTKAVEQIPDPNTDRLVKAIESMQQSLGDRLTSIEQKTRRPLPLGDPIDLIGRQWNQPKIVESPKAPVKKAATPPPAPPAETAQKAAQAPAASGGGSVALQPGEAVRVTCGAPTARQATTTYSYAAPNCSTPTYSYSTTPVYSYSTSPTYTYYTSPTYSYSAAPVATYSAAPAATYSRTRRGLFGSSSYTYSGPVAPARSYNYGYGNRAGGYCTPFGCF